MEEEIPLDDLPADEPPEPVAKSTKKAPAYYEDPVEFQPFDSGSAFSPSEIAATQS